MTDALDRRPGLPAADLHERIREAAFALLLAERRAIAVDEIAAATGAPADALPAMLDQLARAGWVDRDEQGRVTGSAGLSLTTGPIGSRSAGPTFGPGVPTTRSASPPPSAPMPRSGPSARCAAPRSRSTRRPGSSRPIGPSGCGSPPAGPTFAETSVTRRCSCARRSMPRRGPSGRAAAAAPSTWPKPHGSAPRVGPRVLPRSPGSEERFGEREDTAHRVAVLRQGSPGEGYDQERVGDHGGLAGLKSQLNTAPLAGQAGG